MGQQLRAALLNRLHQTHEYVEDAGVGASRRGTARVDTVAHQFHTHGDRTVLLSLFSPTHVEHRFHVECDRKGNFKNLPEEWKAQLNYSEQDVDEIPLESDLLQSHIEAELLTTSEF